MKRDGSDVVQRDLYWDPDDEETAELVDLRPDNVISFERFWRSQGWYAAVASTNDVARAAVVSNFPVKVVKLTDDCARVSTALVEVRRDNAYFKFLMVSFYGVVGSSRDTDVLLRDTCAALSNYGLPFILGGDFQFQPWESPIAGALASGLFFELEDCRLGPIPCTGPKRSRVIDYVVSSRHFTASEAHTVAGVADHAAVFYDIVGCDSVKDVSEAFQADAFQADFDAAEDVDHQWAVLASYADHALTGQEVASSRRHWAWVPRRRDRMVHKAAQLSEPLDLRRLRRLHRRLVQAVQHGCTVQLGRVVRRDLLQLSVDFPSLASFCSADVDMREAHCQVLLCINTRSEELRTSRMRAWRLKAREDCEKQRRWVKDRAELWLAREASTPDVAALSGRAVHPTAALEAELPAWKKLWTAVSNLDEHQRLVDSILERVPGLSEVECAFDVSPSALRQSMQRMVGRRAGSDSLVAQDLLCLPASWWSCFGIMWERVIADCVVPRAWKQVPVSLVPKSNGGFRPIALTAVAWRCGARAICAGLREWIDLWAGAVGFGGLPFRSVSDVHKRVHLALRSGTACGIQEDLRKFFDSVHVPLASRVLRHFGMPAKVIRLFSAFYEGQQRLLMMRGCCAPEWISASRGLVQGCPFSPLVGAAMMVVWAKLVSSSSVLGLSFQDDRTLLAKGSEAVDVQCEELAAANSLSRDFDCAFALTCDPSKSSVVGGQRAQVLADRLGYKRVEVLTLLGVSHPLDLHTPKTLDRFHMAKIRARLRFLPAVTRSCDQVLRHLHCLCFSPLQWAAGYAVPSADDLKSLSEPVKHVLQVELSQEAPQVLYHEVFSWRSSASFCCDWAVLQQGLALHSTRKDWHDELPLSEVMVPWHLALPSVSALMDKLQWVVSGDGSCIWRWDDHQRRRCFRIGFDGSLVLKEWLMLYHRRQNLARCGRVVKSLHRAGEGLAQGLVLPGSQSGSFIRALGHREIWKQAESIDLKRAAMATGGSVWHLGARKSIPSDRQSRCLCGLLMPSRAHLTFACEATRDLRQALEAPSTRVNDRLMARESVEEPPPPHTVADAELGEELAEDLRLPDAVLFAATDGSSEKNVGAAAVLLPQLGFSAVCGLQGEDQGPYKAELWALRLLLQVILKCDLTGLREIHIFCDCEAAILALLQGASSLPLLAQELVSLKSRLTSQGIAVHPHWVPSHGKHSDKWRPWPGVPADRQRAWNHQVDLLAAQECKRRLLPSLRARFAELLRHHKAWELGAIRASAKAADRFDAVLEDPG
eukprot:s5566_g2.t1